MRAKAETLKAETPDLFSAISPVVVRLWLAGMNGRIPDP